MKVEKRKMKVENLKYFLISPKTSFKPTWHINILPGTFVATDAFGFIICHFVSETQLDQQIIQRYKFSLRRLQSTSHFHLCVPHVHGHRFILGVACNLCAIYIFIFVKHSEKKKTGWKQIGKNWNTVPEYNL